MTDAGTASYPSDFDLNAFLSRIWRDRWTFFGVVAVFTVAGVGYAYSAQEWFRAQVLLAPTSSNPSSGLASQLGDLSGLASLAGLGLGGGDTAEPMAVLRSRELTQEFIVENGLLPVLFESEWDSTHGKWKDSDPAKWPDIRDAVKFFNEEVRTVQEEKKTGLVTVSIEWRDPRKAAQWAEMLVAKANAKLRARALAESEANVKYLRDELSKEPVVTLQQSMGRLLDRELQSLMVARGKEDFAFRVIDPAEVPKDRSRPKRVLIVLGAIGAGVAFAFFLILLRSAFFGRRAT